MKIAFPLSSHISPALLALAVFASVLSVSAQTQNADSRTVIGTAGANNPERYHFTSDISLNGDLTVNGPVVIVSDGDFNVGNNSIEITSTGSLKLYVKGDLKISGTGSFNNTNKPEKLIIFGTAEEGQSQDIDLNGNGYLSAVVYAPEANLSSNGGGSQGALLGSVISQNITFHGNPGPFHFDEALKDLVVGNTIYSIEEYFAPGGTNAYIMGDPQKGTYEGFFQQQFETQQP